MFTAVVGFQTPNLKLSPFATSDIIGHVTIGFVIILYVVSLKQPSILHDYQDMVLLRFCGHAVDLLGSRDVIGHVAVGLIMCGILLTSHVT